MKLRNTKLEHYKFQSVIQEVFLRSQNFFTVEYKALIIPDQNFNPTQPQTLGVNILFLYFLSHFLQDIYSRL
jgi:hypothetical protein